MKTQLKGIAAKSLQVARANKRAQFAKDLDKLSSGDYVLVPKEPTQKMLNAGHIIMNSVKGSDVHSATNAKRRECYKAMIEAAQEASL